MATTYRGLSFPFRRDATSFPAQATDDDLLWESIVQLLTTGVGERVMRPDVGSQVLQMLFENDDETLGQMIVADVSTLLARYEPRVLVRSITVTSIDRDEGSITLLIAYVNRATGVEAPVRDVTLGGAS